jgi:hypothetical protein
MAQKVQVLLVDDLDGGQADETVRFGLDGASYEIDLSAGHAQELRSALARYAEAGRKVSAALRGAPARKAARSASNGHNSTEVRDWARAQGIEVKERGRVPADVIAKFKAATGN